MFGFPIGNGNAGFNDFVEKFTNNADSGFPKIQQREVFYSIKDGSWDSPMTWQTASGRVGLLPTAIDDVYVKHNLTLTDIYTINNLFNTGTLTQLATNRSLTINGNLINHSTFSWAAGTSSVIVYGSFISYGLLDMTNNYTLELWGAYNYINKEKFIAGTSGLIGYYRPEKQDILDLPYRNLTIQGGGTKTLQNDLNVLGNLDVRPINKVTGVAYSLNFDIGDYAFSVQGTAYIGGTLTRSTSTKLLFVGRVTLQSFNPEITLNFSGNPEVEFRGGINYVGSNSIIVMNSGTGKWRFTTNNQTIAMGTTAILNLDAQVEIEAGLTLTQTTGVTQFNNTINGISGTSKLVNQATLRFATATSIPSMTTGLYDFTTSANTIEYAGNYSATIPSYFTTFSSLTISGTGTKTLGVNTTLNGNLTLSTGGNLELSTYNFTVTGTTTLSSPNQGNKLSKSGSGSVLFIGNVALPNQTPTAGIDFSLGNPSVELRGGIGGGAQFIYNTVLKTGTGVWTFTTNSQTITSGSSSHPIYFDCPILISGAISLTNATNTTLNSGMMIRNSLNGNNISSTFINKATLGFANSSYITPMSTGVFDISSFSNTIAYVFDGSITLPSISTYKGLWISGSGTKTLQTNTTVNENLTISNTLTGSTLGDGSFELSTYNLTVYGITTQASSNSRTVYAMTKSGSGNILFVGNVNLTANARNVIDFSAGNPNVEFRGGITQAFYVTNAIKSGTGTWTFSTNNQTVSYTDAGTPALTLDCSILISGAITLTISSSTNGYILKGIINGDNASSTLLLGTSTTINYQSATQPMATGILNTSTNLNTWIYGLNNQDIKGGPTTGAKQVYRNLTLNGTGVKTLQGYVSVQNTYTLTSPATLALNGFTLTNP